ncbi:MAG: ABC transporter permease subunit [Pikeienuella sp.]
MAERKTVFTRSALPYLLVLPQLVAALVFVLWPFAEGLQLALVAIGPDGTPVFAGLDTVRGAFTDPRFFASFASTAILVALLAALTAILGLLFALALNRVLFRGSAYPALLIWPAAAMPAVAGAMWYLLLDPGIGALAGWYAQAAPSINAGLAELTAPDWLRLAPEWNHHIYPGQAMVLIVVASLWTLLPVNILLFLAALRSVPKSLLEAAAIDHAGPWRRLSSITLPLLTPTTAVVLILNIAYGLLETFATIQVTTNGGPGGSTSTLLYETWRSGAEGDPEGAAVRALVLTALVAALALLQLRHVERAVRA